MVSIIKGFKLCRCFFFDYLCSAAGALRLRATVSISLSRSGGALHHPSRSGAGLHLSRSGGALHPPSRSISLSFLRCTASGAGLYLSCPGCALHLSPVSISLVWAAHCILPHVRTPVSVSPVRAAHCVVPHVRSGAGLHLSCCGGALHPPSR